MNPEKFEEQPTEAETIAESNKKRELHTIDYNLNGVIFELKYLREKAEEVGDYTVADISKPNEEWNTIKKKTKELVDRGLELLYKKINLEGPIQGSTHRYEPAELIQCIEGIRQGKIILKGITRTNNYRELVGKILGIDK